jgi:hypothetical protein
MMISHFLFCGCHGSHHPPNFAFFKKVPVVCHERT